MKRGPRRTPTGPRCARRGRFRIFDSHRGARLSMPRTLGLFRHRKARVEALVACVTSMPAPTSMTVSYWKQCCDGAPGQGWSEGKRW